MKDLLYSNYVTSQLHEIKTNDQEFCIITIS